MAEITTTPTIIEQNYDEEDVLDFTISKAAQGAMIRDAIKMYVDAPEAIAREYITNALDAHVAAGNTDTPIDVTVVYNEEDGTGELVIQDYGVGLDHDGLRIFTSVGMSSKREAGNEETGSFGRGCKSAFAIATQFTVTTVKDNVKRIAIAYQTEDNSYKMPILKTQETDEGNGTRIAIPLSSKYAYRMADIVANFAQYLEKGSILVNGEEPKHWLDGLEDYDHIRTSTATVIMEENPYRNPVRIKMGAVTYPVDLETLHSNMTQEQREQLDVQYYFDLVNYPAGIDTRHARIVLETPLSTLNLLPSRDGLIYTHDEDDTIGTLVNLLSTLKEEFAEQMQARLNEAETAAEAEIVYHKLAPAMRSTKMTWKGYKYDTTIRAIPEDTTIDLPYFQSNTWTFDVTANRMSVSHTEALRYREGTLRILVDANGTDKELTHYRNKLKDYATTLVDTAYNAEANEDTTLVYVHIFDGETAENPWVFENDNIIKLTVEELELEAAEYRKHRNAIRRRERANQPRAYRPRQETRYTAYFMNGRRYELAVSEIDDSVENVVIKHGDDIWLTDYEKEYLEKTSTIIIFVTGNRSPDKLRDNILKLEQNITILELDVWKDMVKNLILEDEELLENMVWSRYINNVHIMPTLLRFVDYQDGMADVEVLGKTLAEWKDVHDNIDSSLVYRYNVEIQEFNQEKVAEITAELPTDDKVYALYPMLKFINRHYGNDEQESAQIIHDYMETMNTKA